MVVQRYTLITLRSGQLIGQYPVLATSDVAATEAAWQLADEPYCELWSGERLVAFIERNGTIAV